MAYSADKKPGELTALTSLATDDVIVVGDTSDASEVAKGITKANLITDLTTSFATAGHNHTGVYEPANANLLETTDIGVSVAAQGHNHTGTYAPVLGADDNYVTDAEKAALHSHSNKTALDAVSGVNTGDQDLSGLVTKATYDAHTVLYATTDNTPVALTVGEQTVVGRATGGNITALAIDSDLSSVSANDDTLPSAKATKTALDAKAPLASPTFTGTVTLPTGLTGVLRADSGVVSTDSDVTDIVSAASDTAAGKVELATTAETNTGTDTGRAVTPDGLAGSYAGTKSLSVQLFDGATDVTTGDGKAYITIPESLNGMNLIRAQATVVTAGTTNATTVMVHNKTDAQDMLSGAISIASAGTVGTVGTINTTYDDVATNDILRIDVDSVSTTAPKGLMCVLEFRLP